MTAHFKCLRADGEKEKRLVVIISMASYVVDLARGEKKTHEKLPIIFGTKI